MPSIFQPQAPVVLTRDQKLAQVVSNIKQAGAFNFNRISQALQNQFNNVWNNDDFTPQEIFDAFGTDAIQLFQVAGATIALLQIMNSSFVPPTPPAYTANEDGTITVTQS